MKKLLISLLIIIVLVISGLGTVTSFENKTYNIKIKNESIIISEPTITDTNQYVTINLKEATNSLLEPGKPIIPIVTKVFTFPFGTEINNIDVSFSDKNEQILKKEIKPAAERLPVDTEMRSKIENTNYKEVYKNINLYPSINFNSITASGLFENKHVVYLVIQLYPITYSPIQNKIYYYKNADIKITYKELINPMIFNDIYDMMIISHSDFLNELQPLIEHKNNYGVKTSLKTTEDIYKEYDGFDDAEKIKYFIKDSIENFGIEYVLLIGDIEKLPIRASYANFWEENVLTDLYYADIYNDTGGFCSWDENKNGKFGEIRYEHHDSYDIDGVDLYPDVNIGRLACTDTSEVKIVVDKIINYETTTYGQSWFNNIIFCGGDTFPHWNGNEGEQLNNIIEKIMSNFIPTKLWTSTHTFNAYKLNNALNDGAGFVDYSGHGITHGIGTHPPNRNSWIMYYNVNLLGLKNADKLPIIFFDACLTSKLDYDGSETNSYTKNDIISINNLPLIYTVIKPLLKLKILFSNISGLETILTKSSESKNNILSEKDGSTLVPCFSWNFVKKSDGGAIATIGATRTAYGGIENGAGKISIEFFSAYKSSETIGQMMTQAQNGYITDVPLDLLTVEEFILLGDPSLKVGGYQ